MMAQGVPTQTHTHTLLLLLPPVLLQALSKHCPSTLETQLGAAPEEEKGLAVSQDYINVRMPSFHMQSSIDRASLWTTARQRAPSIKREAAASFTSRQEAGSRRETNRTLNATPQLTSGVSWRCIGFCCPCGSGSSGCVKGTGKQAEFHDQSRNAHGGMQAMSHS